MHGSILGHVNQIQSVMEHHGSSGMVRSHNHMFSLLSNYQVPPPPKNLPGLPLGVVSVYSVCVCVYVHQILCISGVVSSGTVCSSQLKICPRISHEL